jgi:hypothetical protein
MSCHSTKDHNHSSNAPSITSAMCRAGAAVSILVLGGCGQSSSVAPTPPVLSSTNDQLAGVVSNAIIGPLAGVRVENVSASSTTAVTVTDADGYFRLPYDFRMPRQLAFTKDGFAPYTLSLPVSSRPSGLVAVTLHLATPPVTLAGTYTVQFVADSSCTQIPDALRVRTYAASLVQASQFPQSTRFDVTLSGASFAQGAVGRTTLDSFTGLVEANSVVLSIENQFEAIELDEGIAETLGPRARLEIEGNASFTVIDPSNFSGSMTGYFALTQDGAIRKCISANHVVAFTRTQTTR